ncbi:hypothetical protein OEA41_010429 [Lepraria neglecta]|uniref:Uncharacterized protein n=1 Tax=Lepraria neglecta TaxID=209136 RepID=A0AAD9YZU5_9LECA|nr:hypothetical protein OEA41_010429 [Lepraria neglecta]
MSAISGCIRRWMFSRDEAIGRVLAVEGSIIRSMSDSSKRGSAQNPKLLSIPAQLPQLQWISNEYRVFDRREQSTQRVGLHDLSSLLADHNL